MFACGSGVGRLPIAGGSLLRTQQAANEIGVVTSPSPLPAYQIQNSVLDTRGGIPMSPVANGPQFFRTVRGQRSLPRCLMVLLGTG